MNLHRLSFNSMTVYAKKYIRNRKGDTLVTVNKWMVDS